MATLVLSAIGTVVGGPIGGAIGAFAGRQVDQQILFKPGDREGPRLQELSVQTSSYGTQIPRLYGTMRAAGTVIWATDLKETKKSEGGGKGKPGTTIYSYSISLAVALSSREISRVGRIWADGKIFRGIAGDFKTTTGYRLCAGYEDQAIDGLIGAAEGQENSPAFRGLAIVIFEDMDLTEYGNRIPSLTFEVFADEGAIDPAGIIEDLSDHGFSVDRISPQSGNELVGFSASGNDIKSAVSAIFSNYPLSIHPGEDGSIVCHRVPDESQVIKSVDEDFAIDVNGYELPLPEYQIRPASDTSSQVSLRYYDPLRDYQAGSQSAFRGGCGRRVSHLQFPATMGAQSAYSLARTMLWTEYHERNTARFHIPTDSIAIRPGSLLKLGQNGPVWRVRRWELRAGVIELGLSKAMSKALTGPINYEAGRSMRELDLLAGSSRLILIDLPFAVDGLMQPSELPRLYAVAAGDEGWRNAQLYAVGPDGDDSLLIDRIAVPGTIAVVETVSGSARPWRIDRNTILDVQLNNSGMTLHDADQSQILIGSNLAMIGSEIIQFARADPLGNNRFRLRHLIRGLGGTESEIDRHEAGENFVLLEGSEMFEIDPKFYTPFQPFNAAIVGRNDVDPVKAFALTTGAALKPWSPVHPAFAYLDSGDLQISWTRRSRGGLLWLDGVEVPVAEESEQYQVLLKSDVAGIEADAGIISEPILTVSQAQLAELYDDGATILWAEIRQIGTYSQSDPLVISIPAKP